MGKLKAGDQAPDFKLQDQSGQEVELSEFKGRKILLYFFPRADTPGCTKQACSIKDAHSELWDLGVAAIGVSPDKVEKQNKFDEKYSLGFPLLSDPDHVVAEQYGVWGEKKMRGKTYMGIIRSSFLIDENGVIIQAWYKVKPLETVPLAEAAAASAN